MALTIANAGTAACTNTDNNVQTISVTVSSGDVLVIMAFGRDTSTPAVPTITDSGAGAIGAWANVGTGINGAVGSARRAHAQYAIVATGGTYTITCTWQATILTLGIGAIKISGADTANPFGAQAAVNGTGTSTAPASGTVNAINNSSNSKLAFCWSLGTADNTFTPEAGWTELFDKGVSETLAIAAMYLTSGASDDTTPTGTLSGSVLWKMSAVEVSVSPDLARLATSRYIGWRRHRPGAWGGA